MIGESGRVLLRDGLALAHEDVGNGRPVVLIHGFTGSRHAWGSGLVRSLRESRRVRAVDLLGHGASDKPESSRRYAMTEVVQDVRELIDDMAAGPVTLIGYSMGARVALAVAVERPDRVASLVLESGSPGLRDPDDRDRRRAADRDLASLLLEDGLDPFLEHWRGLELFRTLPERVGLEVFAEIQAQRGSNDPRALAAVLVGLGTGTQPSYWDRLGEVRCPTLVVTGALDRKFTEIGRSMAAGIPGAAHESMEGCGHRVHLECTDRWLKAVRSFME